MANIGASRQVRHSSDFSVLFSTRLFFFFIKQDVCGLFCVILTWALILYALYVVLNVILLPDVNSFYAIFNGVLFTSIGGLAVASHLRTMLSDPVSF